MRVCLPHHGSFRGAGRPEVVLGDAVAVRAGLDDASVGAARQEQAKDQSAFHVRTMAGLTGGFKYFGGFA